jgi:hypothetical protein
MINHVNSKDLGRNFLLRKDQPSNGHSRLGVETCHTSALLEVRERLIGKTIADKVTGTTRNIATKPAAITIDEKEARDGGKPACARPANTR